MHGGILTHMEGGNGGNLSLAFGIAKGGTFAMGTDIKRRSHVCFGVDGHSLLFFPFGGGLGSRARSKRLRIGQRII